jgi:hypothetical protein
VSVHAVEGEPTLAHRSFRLTRPGPAAPPVASQVRPAIVLPDREARTLLVAAEGADVSRGGCFSAGPAGVQVWSGPWDGPIGSHGSAEHLGSVDWSYDTPSRHYITVYRVLVTSKGIATGLTPAQVLQQVLDLANVVAWPDALTMTAPPARDPFRTVLGQGR